MPKFRVVMVTIEEFLDIDTLTEVIEKLPGFKDKCTHYSVQEIAENGERIGAERAGYPNVIDIRVKQTRN